MTQLHLLPPGGKTQSSRSANGITPPPRANSLSPGVPLPSVSDRRTGWAARHWLIVVTTLFLSSFISCTSDTTDTAPVVKVCTTIDAPEDCPGDQTEFTVGDSLFVHLVSPEPFEAQQIIGKILRLSGTDTISLGARMISIAPDQRAVVQDLPFHEFGSQAAGTFLLEFMNEKNQLVAKKEITIVGS